MKLQIRVKLGLISREPMRVNVLGSIKYMINTGIAQSVLSPGLEELEN